MSHKKLRKEKQCLNCGHEVEERFCSHCGQENLELNDSVIHLVVHYVQDIFHYDGKLWHTLKSLLTRPGLVAKEYMEGRRQQHLEPIRFYVFASTVFFLTFFFILGSDLVTSDITPETNYSKRLFNLKQEKEFLKGKPDTAMVNQLIIALREKAGDTMPVVNDTLENDMPIDSSENPEDTLSESGWLGKFLMEKAEARAEELTAQHGGDETEFSNAMFKEILHTFPQLFFLSLPFFALFLKLLYLPSRKSRYVEHFIFSIYLYVYLFAVMLIFTLLLNLLSNLEGSFFGEITAWLILLMVLYPYIYLLLSMKRFYHDRWRWLIIRFTILMFLFFSILILLFLLFAVITFFL